MPDQTRLLVIELDTPGGLLGSTRGIVELLLGSPIPVAVYVTPPGPGQGRRHLYCRRRQLRGDGARHQHRSGQPCLRLREDLEETVASKAENDAAALIRSIAQERGRNEDKLEETVRQAASFTATEAVDYNVVDFIAEDLDDLLEQLQGREAETESGTQRLDVQGVGGAALREERPGDFP